MQRVLGILAIYNMFQIKRSTAIKTKKYQSGKSFDCHYTPLLINSENVYYGSEIYHSYTYTDSVNRLTNTVILHNCDCVVEY